MTTRKPHDYLDFMKASSDWLAQEYSRIQRRTLEDPGTAGDQAEENWATLFRNWLPATYPVVTKGRLISADGVASPQVDILVLQPWYPVSLRDKKLYFAGGVVAAFECKLTLRTTHLKKCIKNAFLVKSHTPKQQGTPYDELHQPIIYGLLAHSQDIKSKDKDPVYALLTKVQESTGDVLDELSEERPLLTHPAYMLDIICVANTATITLNKSIEPNRYRPETIATRDVNETTEVETAYIAQRESPERPYTMPGQILGSLVNNIIRRMAFEDTSLRVFAEYLAQTGFWGGIGPIISWNTGTISPSVLEQLKVKVEKGDQFSRWQSEF